MLTRPLLVVGIHQEEREFGEQVARRLRSGQIDVLCIPEGIPQNKRPGEASFYHRLRHREIYLQLRQQVLRRYGLILDLHAGINETGRCADVYCRDVSLLSRLDDLELSELRTVHITAENRLTPPALEKASVHRGHITHAVAHTIIPEEVWNSRDFLYVGLEVYVTQAGEGTQDDWFFTCTLVDLILRCGDGEITEASRDEVNRALEGAQKNSQVD